MKTLYGWVRGKHPGPWDVRQNQANVRRQMTQGNSIYSYNTYLATTVANTVKWDLSIAFMNLYGKNCDFMGNIVNLCMVRTLDVNDILARDKQYIK